MDSVVYPELPYNAVICRYNEIATKGHNRRQFEILLVQSLRRNLEGLGKLRIMRERGRIFVRFADKTRVFSAADCQLLRDCIPRVCGLASASPGFLTPPEFPAIEAAVLNSFPQVYAAVAAKIPEPQPIQYSMRARRNNRAFPMTSNDLEILFADKFLDEYPRLHVNLKQADLCVQVEIRQKRAFVFYEQIPGPGGLPAGSGGKVLALLSGGIDSPVACYQMMKRGCNVSYITFHSDPYTPRTLIRKVSQLAKILDVYQNKSQLFAVNLLPAQTHIRTSCQARYRTVLYRRMMMRIATVTAHAIKARGLVTGDNIGQVASQTLANMAVISAATPMLIMRPLVAFDKVESVNLAKTIGTMELSNEDIPDSCTVFAPTNPATRSKLPHILAEEARLDIPYLLKKCIEQTYEIVQGTTEERPCPQLAASLERLLAAGQLEIPGNPCVTSTAEEGQTPSAPDHLTGGTGDEGTVNP